MGNSAGQGLWKMDKEELRCPNGPNGRKRDRVPGPAIVMEMDSTTVILPKHTATVDGSSCLLIYPDNYKPATKGAAQLKVKAKTAKAKPAKAKPAKAKPAKASKKAKPVKAPKKAKATKAKKARK